VQRDATRAPDSWAARTAYGATGHTGRFVVAELLERGFATAISGRDAVQLEVLAAGWGEAAVRPAAVDDPRSLDRALAGAAAVVNCAGPFAVTGGPVVGDVNQGARWYNPESGTFNSPDTMSYAAGVASSLPNLYAYGAGNPVTLNDPTGNSVFHDPHEEGGCVRKWADQIYQNAVNSLGSTISKVTDISITSLLGSGWAGANLPTGCSPFSMATTCAGIGKSLGPGAGVGIGSVAVGIGGLTFGDAVIDAVQTSSTTSKA
jgi:RHS repeat-associated protein